MYSFDTCHLSCSLLSLYRVSNVAFGTTILGAKYMNEFARARYSLRHTLGTARAALLILCAVVLAGCAGEVPTQAEIKQENLTSQAEQLVRVGDTTRAGGDTASALQLYRRAANMKPEWPTPWFRIGETASIIGLYRDAEDAFKRLIALDGQSLDAYLGLGNVMVATRRYDDALNNFEEAARIAPTDNRGHNGAGVALDLMGQHDVAQERYINGIELAPDNLPLRSNLGLSLALVGDYDAAIEILEELVTSPGNSAQTRQNLALVYGLAGDEDRAAEIAGLDLGPRDVANNITFYRRLREMPAADRAAQVFSAIR